MLISYAFLYLISYNSSLSLLILLCSNFNIFFKSLNFFKIFSNLFFYKNIILILILSIAGIPPFIGFFTKLNLIFFLNLNSFLIITFFLFFFLTSMYFYIQNIRFVLNDSFFGVKTYNYFNENFNFNYLNVIVLILCLLVFGFFLLDDLFLISYWSFL